MTGTGSSDAASIELLAADQRRYLLQCLEDREDGMALADLAADVAALELDADPREVSHETVQHVYVSLYHRHVPKLADADLVEYDDDRNVVALATDTPDVTPVPTVVE